MFQAIEPFSGFRQHGTAGLGAWDVAGRVCLWWGHGGACQMLRWGDVAKHAPDSWAWAVGLGLIAAKQGVNQFVVFLARRA